jgi:hypothetical protein
MSKPKTAKKVEPEMVEPEKCSSCGGVLFDGDEDGLCLSCDSDRCNDCEENIHDCECGDD